MQENLNMISIWETCNTSCLNQHFTRRYSNETKALRVGPGLENFSDKNWKTSQLDKRAKFPTWLQIVR